MAAVLVVRDFVDSNREIFVVIFLLLSGRIRQHLTEGTSN
tara:strand:+ start:3162 stop:3281 length:120 start_codon:yes stop_codon:yes gene_type:complete